MKHIESIFTKIMLYTLAIIHLPWTIVRVLVATILIVDEWGMNLTDKKCG